MPLVLLTSVSIPRSPASERTNKSRAGYCCRTESARVVHRHAVTVCPICSSQNYAVALRRYGNVAARDVQFRVWSSRSDANVAVGIESHSHGTAAGGIPNQQLACAFSISASR